MLSIILELRINYGCLFQVSIDTFYQDYNDQIVFTSIFKLALHSWFKLEKFLPFSLSFAQDHFAALYNLYLT